MAFNSLGKLLPQRLKQTGIAREVGISQVIAMANELLNEVFGPETTDYQAQAISLKHRRLSIATMNASFRQELVMRERDFIYRLNQRAGKPMVEAIKVIL